MVLQGFLSERELRTGQMWSFLLLLPDLGLSVAPLRRKVLAVRHLTEQHLHRSQD